MLAVDAMAVAPSMANASPSPDDSNWSSYNLRLGGNRFSELSQINTGNVSRLTQVCQAELAQSGSASSGLVLAQGVLYVVAWRGSLFIGQAMGSRRVSSAPDAARATRHQTNTARATTMRTLVIKRTSEPKAHSL